jgi:hypothetical protein
VFRKGHPQKPCCREPDFLASAQPNNKQKQSRTPIKKTLKHLFAASLAVAISSTALAQPVINIDETGVGTFGGAPLTSGTLLDTNSGLTTLVYFLPFPGVAGDVALVDTSGVGSDVLRWDGNFHLFVFSDNSDVDSPTPIADVGLPAALLPLSSVLLETGPEAGPNGLFNYNPGFTGPGGNTAGATYNFISDPAPVPEPGTLALFAGGLGVLSLPVRRRKNPRA